VHVLLLAAAFVSGGPSAGRVDEFVFFRTPSRNIVCVERKAAVSRSFLRCDILSRLRPLPPRPRGCNLDWGFSFELRSKGRATVTCAGDSANSPSAKVIPYGATWRLGPFRCTSRRTGLRCRNLSGHGFFLSRPHSYRF
jgi:hypothetical protein